MFLQPACFVDKIVFIDAVHDDGPDNHVDGNDAGAHHGDDAAAHHEFTLRWGLSS